MEKENHYYFETNQDGVCIILEIPKEKKMEKDTKNEIKHILTIVLNQYLTNVSEAETDHSDNRNIS